MDFQVAEQAVLAGCLRDESGECAALALERLTDEDFVNPTHQKIFDLVGKFTPLNEVDVAIHMPELALDAVSIAEKHGGGSIYRYIDHLIESRNLRSVEKAILFAQDEIKEGKSAEDVAGSFTTRVAKSISKGRGQVKCGSAGNEAYSEFLRGRRKWCGEDPGRQIRPQSGGDPRASASLQELA